MFYVKPLNLADMTKIKKFGLARLHVEEDFGFQQLVVAETPRLKLETESGGGDEDLPVVQSALDSPFAEALKTKVETFKTAHENFDAALKGDSQAPSSAAVSQADEARDYAWRGLSSYVKALLMHPRSEVVALASKTKDILDKYGNPTSLTQTEESGVIHNTLQELEAMPEEERTEMGIDEWNERLRTENDKFVQLVKQKAAEEAALNVGIIKQSRKEADNAYRSLVNMINMLVEVEGDENYKDFIAVVNKHIEKQQKTLKNRESRGDDDSDDTDETPEEPTDTPDNPSETPDQPTDTPDETPENPDEQPGGQEDDDRPVVQ